MSKSKLTRRQLLQKSGLVGVVAGASVLRSPHELLANALIKNAFNVANAATPFAATTKSYVNIMMLGGPLRYTFDHWLRTNAGDPALVYNSTTGTSFTYNATTRQVTGTEYKTINHKGLEIPQLFAALSPADRDSFLNSFLVVRGYGSNIDGHPNNSAIQMLPLAGAVSLSGLLSDQSNLSYKAVQVPARGASSKFFSANSVGQNVLGKNDPLGDLLAPISAASTARSLRTGFDAAFTQLRSALNQSADRSLATTLTQSSLEDASKLLKSDFGDYATEFDSAKAAYDGAVNTALRSTRIPGINSTHDGSQSLQLISDGSLHYQVDGNPSFHTFAAGDDLVQTTSAMTIPGLSSYLALAEYCIVHGLSTSIEILGENLSNILDTPGGTATVRQVHDCHQSGDITGIFYYSHYYLGLMQGLLKFKERLQAAGKWSNTIVHITSDFNRSVNGATGLGSGHGFNQMVASVFSGMIAGGPYVVGNVAQRFEGYSQGRAAIIPGYSAAMPSPLSMASTLYPFFDVPNNPWKNLASPLVSLNANGTLFLPYGAGKVVA